MIDPKDVVARKLQGFNAQNSEETMSCFSPAIVMATPIGVLRGKEQVGQFFSAFWTAFPDLKLHLVLETGEGPYVAVQNRSVGTHLGTLSTPDGDIPASGRTLDLAISDNYEVRDGLIVAAQLYFDRLALLEQLGAVPAGATN
jgi:predicted ester cyclase